MLSMNLTSTSPSRPSNRPQLEDQAGIQTAIHQAPKPETLSDISNYSDGNNLTIQTAETNGVAAEEPLELPLEIWGQVGIFMSLKDLVNLAATSINFYNLFLSEQKLTQRLILDGTRLITKETTTGENNHFSFGNFVGCLRSQGIHDLILIEKIYLGELSLDDIKARQSELNNQLDSDSTGGDDGTAGFENTQNSAYFIRNVPYINARLIDKSIDFWQLEVAVRILSKNSRQELSASWANKNPEFFCRLIQMPCNVTSYLLSKGFSFEQIAQISQSAERVLKNKWVQKLVDEERLTLNQVLELSPTQSKALNDYADYYCSDYMKWLPKLVDEERLTLNQVLELSPLQIKALKDYDIGVWCDNESHSREDLDLILNSSPEELDKLLDFLNMRTYDSNLKAYSRPTHFHRQDRIAEFITSQKQLQKFGH